MEERLDAELLKILACPACRKALTQNDPQILVCSGCGKRYPVEGGIPRLIV